jgi:hypothetical protein
VHTNEAAQYAADASSSHSFAGRHTSAAAPGGRVGGRGPDHLKHHLQDLDDLGGETPWKQASSAESVGEFAHLGFVGPDDLVRRSDRTDWMPARSVRDLFKPPE